MSLNTYGHSLDPAAGVYEDVYFITPVTDTRAPHVIFFFLSSSLSPALSLHPDVATVGAASGGGCEPTSRCRDPARRGRAADDRSATAEQQDTADAELTARAVRRGRDHRGARGLTDVLLAFPGGGRLLLHGRCPADLLLHGYGAGWASRVPPWLAPGTPPPP